jgi:hypothetical protein
MREVHPYGLEMACQAKSGYALFPFHPPTSAAPGLYNST